MIRFLPRTLFGQTLLALLVGISLALAVGAWIYASARQEAVRAVGALAAAERIVNLTQLLADVPATWRDRIVEGASDQAFRVTLTRTQPTTPRSASESEQMAAAAIAELLRDALPGHRLAVRVYAWDRTNPAVAPRRTGDPPHAMGMGRRPGPGNGMGPADHAHRGGGPGAGNASERRGLARAAMSWRALEARVELADSQWLTFATTLPDAGPAMSPRLMVALLVATAIIAALTAWAVRRATAPLRLLSQAAERLGRNVDSPPLSITGTIETQRASAAFNEMQARLRRLIENRTLMLAAISHDLRTELQLLKLKAEAIEPAEDRARMLATIAEMEAMLTATLSFAREEAASETMKRTDIAALVASIVDDLADAGRDVAIVGAMGEAVAEIKPVALRRALANLIDNAVKYGNRARVALITDAHDIAIRIDDDGPGIPDAELQRVLQPFVRLEISRSRDTGGMGLGLAIAASVADAHGGTLRLANRPEGGLSVTLALPRG